jgi:hypothetical protein
LVASLATVSRTREARRGSPKSRSANAETTRSTLLFDSFTEKLRSHDGYLLQLSSRIEAPSDRTICEIFDGSTDVHVHFHMLVLDGVYALQGDTLIFHPAPAPTRAELEALVRRIHARVLRWLGRRGLLRDPYASNDTPAPSPAEALALAGTQRGTLTTLRDDSVKPGFARRPASIH